MNVALLSLLIVDNDEEKTMYKLQRGMTWNIRGPKNKSWAFDEDVLTWSQNHQDKSESFACPSLITTTEKPLNRGLNPKPWSCSVALWMNWAASECLFLSQHEKTVVMLSANHSWIQTANARRYFKPRVFQDLACNSSKYFTWHLFKIMSTQLGNHSQTKLRN